ncbi:L-threonylcarbamoyladenylate synthase [Streptomyces sp. NPDC090442]|uniref:L-threonylcarbamoyladenylate synthase n=1 Tax=Streptomyces sp. NPDC090442 TaxID=3365962 RepID=UPI0038307C80
MSNTTPRCSWQGEVIPDSLEAISAPGGLVVCATKVGYILMATDGGGLERKFDAKQRNKNKPGVVLCADIEHLKELAQLNEEVLSFYEQLWEQDVLIGCILPWRKEALTLLPDATTRELAMDARGTSCFVVRFGRPAEQLVERLWAERRLVFASSANPSGHGNKGRVEGIGSRIETQADFIVSADDYVASIQPGKDENTRHEQGVMVSMVDSDGALVPVQDGERSVSPVPALIRHGLDSPAIMESLSAIYSSWDYRQGEYY